MIATMRPFFAVALASLCTVAFSLPHKRDLWTRPRQAVFSTQLVKRVIFSSNTVIANGDHRRTMALSVKDYVKQFPHAKYVTPVTGFKSPTPDMPKTHFHGRLYETTVPSRLIKDANGNVEHKIPMASGRGYVKYGRVTNEHVHEAPATAEDIEKYRRTHTGRYPRRVEVDLLDEHGNAPSEAVVANATNRGGKKGPRQKEAIQQEPQQEVQIEPKEKSYYDVVHESRLRRAARAEKLSLAKLRPKPPAQQNRRQLLTPEERKAKNVRPHGPGGQFLSPDPNKRPKTTEKGASLERPRDASGRYCQNEACTTIELDSSSSKSPTVHEVHSSTAHTTHDGHVGEASSVSNSPQHSTRPWSPSNVVSPLREHSRTPVLSPLSDLSLPQVHAHWSSPLRSPSGAVSPLHESALPTQLSPGHLETRPWSPSGAVSPLHENALPAEYSPGHLETRPWSPSGAVSPLHENALPAEYSPDSPSRRPESPAWSSSAAPYPPQQRRTSPLRSPRRLHSSPSWSAFGHASPTHDFELAHLVRSPPRQSLLDVIGSVAKHLPRV
ncbi:hypothetical protein CBOM_07069 [Ceraceosorus bombacis]|uniref:Uncharacterized protein n=1 Tax=Ceraceosorus bombacis TaxID=401625 RepID=A0A0P1B7P1_9BASI|nr:hypothetical protein CBOM_07069 [Ceraceosorus bombacis]